MPPVSSFGNLRILSVGQQLLIKRVRDQFTNRVMNFPVLENLFDVEIKKPSGYLRLLDCVTGDLIDLRQTHDPVLRRFEILSCPIHNRLIVGEDDNLPIARDDAENAHDLSRSCRV